MSIIDLLQKEQAEEETGINSSSKLLQEILYDIFSSEYVNSLIYDHPKRLAALHSIFQAQDLDLTPHFVFTVVLDDFWNICENKDNAYRSRLKQGLLSSVRKTLQPNYRALAATLTGTDKVVVLLECQNLTKEEAKTYAMQCASALVQKVPADIGYSISIGISNFCPSPALLYRSYEQAFQALKQSFHAGSGQILMPGPTTQGSAAFSQHSLMEQRKRSLIISITNQEDSLCAQTLDQLSDDLSTQNADPSYIKSLLVSFLSEIAGYCIRLGLDPRDVSAELLSATAAIFKTDTMANAKKEAFQFLRGLSLRLKSKANESSPLDIAAAYLEQYFASNPGLIEVAELCGYTPSYFSRSFKEKFGVTFVRYQKNIQIKNAKKLLRESDLSLAEVCDKTGFQSLSYFSTVFKKETGVSPAQYRGLVRE